MKQKFIIGNSAGVFSGLITQLSWMLVSENPENNIDISLHTVNKTNVTGNQYIIKPSLYGEKKRTQNLPNTDNFNLLPEFFKQNNFINYKMFDKFKYIELHPLDIFKEVDSQGEPLIKKIPDCLLYKGCDVKQYKDKENLEKIRQALNNQWNKLEFTDQFSKFAAQEESLISGKKVLSVMLRTAKHYIDPITQKPITDSNYVIQAAIDSVKKKIDNYDSVLVVTQIKPFVDAFVKEFGNSCIFTERKRFETDCDWVGGRTSVDTKTNIVSFHKMSDEEYKIEYTNAILDVFLASKTNYILSSTSNMLMGALAMNPKINFSFIENLSDHTGA